MDETMDRVVLGARYEVIDAESPWIGRTGEAIGSCGDMFLIRFAGDRPSTRASQHDRYMTRKQIRKV